LLNIISIIAIYWLDHQTLPHVNHHVYS